MTEADWNEYDRLALKKANGHKLSVKELVTLGNYKLRARAADDKLDRWINAARRTA